MIEFAMLIVTGAFHGGVAALLDGFALASERHRRVMASEQPVGEEFRLTVLSRDGGDIVLDQRVTLKVDRSIANEDAYDFVWVPSFRAGGEKPLADLILRSNPEAEWLARQWRQGAVIGASGAAVVLPLAAGIAKGLSVPVVPALSPTLRALFPRAAQDGYRRIVDQDNLLLGRGASLDTELVARAFDRLISPATGHWFRSVMGEAPASRDEKAADPLVETARLWLEQRFAGSVSIAGLARELNVSQAVLVRRFRNEMGETPTAFVKNLRLNTARRMLVDSRLSIDMIAAAVGFSDARLFRQAFRRSEGMSASAWRELQISSAD